MGERLRCGGWAIACGAVLALLSGCIGPSTPLGAVDDSLALGPEVRAQQPPEPHTPSSRPTLPPEPEPAAIRFSPAYQQVHGPYPWLIAITDPSTRGMPDASRVRVFYGDHEVTESARFQFRKEVALPEGEHPAMLLLTLSPLRLDALEDHTIIVEYTSGTGERLVAEYPFPELRDMEAQELILSTRPFSVAPQVRDAIYEASRAHRINPALLAALVAQESSFNPNAVSKAKAMGLTQITSLAARDISRRYPNWPRYPGIQKFSKRRLRRLIPKVINRKNEWRLDPVKSIWGGAYYLGYLRDRLEVEANAATVAKGGPDREKVVTEAALAAYNSGLNRILFTIKRHEERWLEQRQTREAKRYVRKILSYYGSFRDGGDPTGLGT